MPDEIQLGPTSTKETEKREAEHAAAVAAAAAAAEQAKAKAAEPAEPEDLDSMTKAELLELADKRNIKVDKSGLKADIIEALEDANEGEPNPDPGGGVTEGPGK